MMSVNIFQLPEPEDVKEIPGDGGHPAGVQGLQLDAALQHRLEPQGEGEGHLGAHWSLQPGTPVLEEHFSGGQYCEGYYIQEHYSQ